MANLIDAARRGRRSGAALKIRLAEIRSKAGTALVFVFEGRDDVGPYETWVGRIDESLEYIPLPGSGKGQLLDLRQRLQRDQTGLRQNTYFFLDRDYDLLRTQTPDADVFCTHTYSIENCLVSKRILASILIDEFRLDQYRDRVVDILKHFDALLNDFLEIMREPNWFIYLRASTSARSGSISDQISAFVHIHWQSVSRAYTDDTLPDLIPVSCRSDSSSTEADTFARLDPHTHYRGKHLLGFFLSWLDALSHAVENGDTSFFSERIAHKFNRGALTLRNLASRSELPRGLAEFIGTLRST